MKNNNVIQKLLAIFIPRLGEIFFIAIFAAVIGLGPRMMNVDGDLGRHLTLGSYIIDKRRYSNRRHLFFHKDWRSFNSSRMALGLIFAIDLYE